MLNFVKTMLEQLVIVSCDGAKVGTPSRCWQVSREIRDVSDDVRDIVPDEAESDGGQHENEILEPFGSEEIAGRDHVRIIFQTMVGIARAPQRIRESREEAGFRRLNNMWDLVMADIFGNIEGGLFSFRHRGEATDIRVCLVIARLSVCDCVDNWVHRLTLAN